MDQSCLTGAQVEPCGVTHKEICNHGNNNQVYTDLECTTQIVQGFWGVSFIDMNSKNQFCTLNNTMKEVGGKSQWRRISELLN